MSETPAQPLPRSALWAALIVAWLGWMFDGLEMGLYSWAVPPALRELLHTADPGLVGRGIGYTVALFLAGMSLGGVVFGRLGDRIGRVRTLIITVLVYAFFTGLSGLCHAFWQLAACRFLGAMGLGGEWGLGVALVMETWPNASRPVLAGALGAAANVGFLAAARITAYLSRHDLSWRYALVVGVAPALLTLVVRLCVRESKRWEESRERGRTAGFADLFGPELLRHSLVGIALSAVAVLGMWGVYQAWLQAWVDTLVGPGDALKGARDAARAAVSTYMAVGSIFGALLGGWAAEKLGRRLSYAIFCVGATAVSMTLYLTTTAFDQRMLWLAALGGVFATAFFGWLPLYLPELFPTHLRSTGEGLTFNAGRILSAGGVLVAGRLVEALHGQKYAGATMACVWLVGLVVIAFAPETKGCELPE